MEQNRKKKKTRVFLKVTACIAVFCLVTVFFVWWKDGGENWYRYEYHKNHEPFTLRRTTSSDPIYPAWYLKEKLSEYSYFDGIDLDKAVSESYIIPGLISTRTLLQNTSGNMDICTSMTPQGIALTEEYVLISSYCQMKQHHSVIYVVDRNTHEFIKEVVLPDLTHAGSIAYDEVHRNIWVCCHDNNSSVAFVRSISLEHLESYSFDEEFKPVAYDQSYPLITQVRASFMTCYDNALYVGYYQSNLKEETSVQKFVINDSGGLNTVVNPINENYDDPDEILLPDSLAVINGGAQGVTMSDDNMYILTSHGSVKDSILYCFSNTLDEDGNQNARSASALQKWKLPPMAEEIYLADNKMYVCFESGAYAYRARKCVHMDRILVFDMKENQ